MTKAGFEKAAHLIADAYPGKPLTVREAASWYGLLVPIPDEAGLKAAVSVCRESVVRPSLGLLYQRAQEYVRATPPAPVPSLPAPPIPSLPEVRMLAAQLGTHMEAVPIEAVAIDMAVEIIAEKIRGTHPGIHGRELYQPVMAAICGRGPYADLWRLLRGYPTSESLRS